MGIAIPGKTVLIIKRGHDNAGGTAYMGTLVSYFTIDVSDLAAELYPQVISVMVKTHYGSNITIFQMNIFFKIHLWAN